MEHYSNKKNNSVGTVRINAETLNIILVILTVIITVTPYLSKSVPVFIKILIIMLWYFDAYVIKRRRVTGFEIFLLGWVAINIVLKLIGVSTAEYGNYITLLAFVDIIIKTIYIQKYYKEETKRKILRLIQVLIMGNVISNIILGLQYERIHFLIFFYPEKYDNLNVAQTEFYNMISVFVSICMFMFTKEKQLFFKVVDILAIAVSIYFLFVFEPRTTAVIIMFFAIVCVFYARVNAQSNRILGIFFVILILLCTVFIAKDFIISILPERIAIRINSLLNIGVSGIEDDIYLGRFELIGNSIRTFLASPKNFLIGIGYHLGNQFYEYVGQHSVITDYLAWYGCVGLFVMCYMLSSIRKNMIICCTTNESIRYTKNIFMVFVFASIVSNSFRPEFAVTTILMQSLCTTKCND